MELKKILSASLACTLCITMLTACSGNENPSETSDAAIDTDIDNNADTTTQEVTTLKELDVTEAEINPEYQVITVNGNAANTNPASAYRGLGAVTGNNSSRLLMDYKEKNPDRYWEIMNLLFKKDYGAGLTHVKIEFGTDVNSSSGTEPSTMRSEDEKANVRRGAGFMFAADALSINPDITVDLLRWGEPKWVTDAFEEGEEKGHEARYKWYKETIDAAYDEYGIKFSYISADANEAEHVDVDWIIYFSDRLKNETEERYDYSQIKIVASDEIGSWNIAKEMTANEELRSAVDVLAEHYNTWASNEAKLLNTEYEKEIWYSEGVASTNIAKLAVTSNGSGINGVNGCLDVCNRIINGYYNGTMVMYEYQPAVAAYYSGAKFFPKSIINAIEPWSGYYEPDAGIWTSAHFTMFAEKGWQYIDGACYGDGKESHSITESTNNYMTLTDPKTGDYSIIVCNDSDAERNYTFNVSNLNKAQNNIYIWETTGPKTEAEAYNANYLQLTGTLKPVNDGDGTYSYSISVKPYSIITITTLQKDNVTIPSAITCPVNSEVLTLPYSDDFEYGEEFINSRGGTPLYTTDQGGAFEVAVQDGNSVLMQMITAENKPTDWRYRGTPNPITSLGDDRWSDYSASIDFTLASSSGENYIGLGVRYLSSETSSNTAESGYILKIYGDGKWELRKNTKTVESGNISDFDSAAKHTVKITADGCQITAELDGEQLANTTDESGYNNSGRVSLCSGYYNNTFDNLKVEAASDKPYSVNRIDDHDASVSYTGEWENTVPQGYTEYNRTTYIADSTKLSANVTSFSEENNKASSKFYFEGFTVDTEKSTAFSNESGSVAIFTFQNKCSDIIGTALSDCVVNVYLDDTLVEEGKTIDSGFSGAVATVKSDTKDKHQIKLELVSGEMQLESAEHYAVNEGSCSLSFKFTGTEFALVGPSGNVTIELTLDGETSTENLTSVTSRQTFLKKTDLEIAEHTIIITVLEGKFVLDAIETK